MRLLLTNQSALFQYSVTSQSTQSKIWFMTLADGRDEGGWLQRDVQGSWLEVSPSVTRLLDYFSSFGHLHRRKFAQKYQKNCQSKYKILPNSK